MEEIEKIRKSLELLWEVGVIHEDLIVNIHELMNKWFQNNLTQYNDLLEEIYEEIGSDSWYELITEYEDLTEEELNKIENRYRNTFIVCLESKSYDEEEIYKDIE